VLERLDAVKFGNFWLQLTKRPPPRSLGSRTRFLFNQPIFPELGWSLKVNLELLWQNFTDRMPFLSPN